MCCWHVRCLVLNLFRTKLPDGCGAVNLLISPALLLVSIPGDVGRRGVASQAVASASLQGYSGIKEISPLNSERNLAYNNTMHINIF